MKRLALWTAIPAFAGAASAALVTAASGDLMLGLVGALAAAVAVGYMVENRLAKIARALGAIARGDRYAPAPLVKDKGAIRALAALAESMRGALTHIDDIAVDRDRSVTESKLRQAGRIFITRRFQNAIGEVTQAFTGASERIQITARNLAQRNDALNARVAGAAQSATIAAADAEHVAQAARKVRDIVSQSDRQIAMARQATERTAADLSEADQTMQGLAGAAQQIDGIVKLIETIAGQTSLLSLNATIEAARAGEAGRGFAVVANEVKQLAQQTGQATGQIRAQVQAMQKAVQQTALAISAVSRSVETAQAVNRDLNALIEIQITELDNIGNEALSVATTVSEAMPNIQSAISEVAEAGDAMLGTAEELAARSQSLVTSVKGYFSDLEDGAIKIGILHSLTGTLTASERPLQQLLVMLVEEVNAQGGLLGRPLEAVIANPESQAAAYAIQANALLREHKVAAIFGCWTSASRLAVAPVLAQHKGLLFYPSQYEGEPPSPHIFYLGGTPRQQLIPAIGYLQGLGRKRFFMLGSDAHYSRATNAILREHLRGKGLPEIALQEFYANAAQIDWELLAERLRKFAAGGDGVVVSTLSGDSNLHFYRALAAQGISAAQLPVMSLSIGEAELPPLAGSAMAGHLVAWNYLHSLDNPHNRAFIAAWRDATHNPLAITNDAMEATLIGFRLWCAGVEASHSVEPLAVAAAIAGRAFAAPSGFTVRMDASNRHLHKPAFVGRIDAGGAIARVFSSEGLEPPEPQGRAVSAAPRAA